MAQLKTPPPTTLVTVTVNGNEERLPKGKKGAYRVIVQYQGNKKYKKSKAVLRFTLR